MKFRLCILLFTAHFAHADSKAPQAIVWARYPNAVRKFFPADKYKIIDAEVEKKELHETGYLYPQERDALFQKLNLLEALRPLDEMDKDLLILRARSEEIQYFAKRYPMLSEAQLRQLQREVRELAKK